MFGLNRLPTDRYRCLLRCLLNSWQTWSFRAVRTKGGRCTAETNSIYLTEVTLLSGEGGAGCVGDSGGMMFPTTM